MDQKIVDITNMTVIELKSLAFDLMQERDRANEGLQKVHNMIIQKLQQDTEKNHTVIPSEPTEEETVNPKNVPPVAGQ